MKKQVLLLISVFVSFFSAIDSQVVASESGFDVFGTCNSDDLARIENGGWYWYEGGRGGSGRGWVYGGSYVTSNERINKSDYGKGSGYIKITGYRLKRIDGTWWGYGRHYFPLTSVDSVCK